MDFEFEELFMETIFPWLFKMPGGLLRWVFEKLTGKKKTYREYYNKEPILTGFIGVLFWVFLILTLIYS